VPPTHVVDGVLLADALRFPDLSVMRSSECRDPDDARWISEGEVKPGQPLVVYDDHYVFGIAVRDVPPQIPGEAGGKEYRVTVAHVPYDDLYPHSEIWLMKDGVQIDRRNKIPATIKRKVRDQLAARAKELAKPQK
jgi:hypothetical protein